MAAIYKIYIIYLCYIQIEIIISQSIYEEIFKYEHLNVMRTINGGKFTKGVDDRKSDSGEYPTQQAEVKTFYIDIYPVTNAQFLRFQHEKSKYKTTAERKGWSWVFEKLVSDKLKEALKLKLDDAWWVKIKGARWDRPEGIDSSIRERLDHPVVHVSQEDAMAYCQWRGKRLPTENEWEFAARGGLHQKDFPWGGSYRRNRTNLWQGKFPNENILADDWEGISPVDYYKTQNEYLLYDMIGNVWEWTTTRYYERVVDRALQDTMYVLKGGSYLDSKDGSANQIVRNSQRLGEQPDYTAHNIGFRCVKSAKTYWKSHGHKKPKKEEGFKSKPRKPKHHGKDEL